MNQFKDPSTIRVVMLALIAASCADTKTPNDEPSGGSSASGGPSTSSNVAGASNAIGGMGAVAIAGTGGMASTMGGAAGMTVAASGPAGMGPTVDGGGGMDGGVGVDVVVDMTVVQATYPLVRIDDGRRGRLMFEREFDGWRIYSAFDSDMGFREHDWACHLSLFQNCELVSCALPQSQVEGLPSHPGPLTLENLASGETIVVNPNEQPGPTPADVYPRIDDSSFLISPGDEVYITAAGTTDVPTGLFGSTLLVPEVLVDADATALPADVPENGFIGANGLGFTWGAGEGRVMVRWSSGAYDFDSLNPTFSETAYCVYEQTEGTAGLSPSLIDRVGCNKYSAATLYSIDESQGRSLDYVIVMQVVVPSAVSGFVSCLDGL